MSEISRYEEYENKLQKLCEDNDLSFDLELNQYPITLTIRPNGNAAQLVLFEPPQEEPIGQPAAICFSFENGELRYSFSRSFAIRDDLLSKIKSLFKNIYFYWLQFFFREVWEKEMLLAGQMPHKQEN